MTGGTTAVRRAAAVVLVGVLAAACSTADAPEATQDPQDDTPSGAVATPSGAASSAGAPATSSSHATHDGLEVPDTRSGPLTRRDFPRPRELGPGWSYRVDMGDAEEGYTGNSTPVLERDPTEVAMLAVPFGCPRPVEVPVPEHALEVDYTAEGATVVAVRASFGDPRTASRFFGTRARLLRRCEDDVISKSEGILVEEVRRLSATALLNDRTPDSDPWTEVAVHDGDQVVLIAAQTRIDQPPMTPTTVADLVQAFRR